MKLLGGHILVVGDKPPDDTIDKKVYYYDFLANVLWSYYDDSKAWEDPNPRWMHHTSSASRYEAILRKERISNLERMIKETEKDKVPRRGRP